MKFGVCTGAENVKTVKEAGFDYIEINFSSLAKMNNSDFLKLKNDLIENNLSCLFSNCFIPGEYSICSENLNKSEIEKFIEQGMSRGKEIGMHSVAFGSGKARNALENQEYSIAFSKISEFLKDICVPLCEKYDFTIAIEPLRKKETNIINTVTEAKALCDVVNNGKIKILADIFHMVCSDDDFKNIEKFDSCIHHAHISHPIADDGEMTRIYPKNKNEYDYSSFIKKLKNAGCKTCSIEARTEDIKTDAFESIKLLKSL